MALVLVVGSGRRNTNVFLWGRRYVALDGHVSNPDKDSKSPLA